VITRSPDPEQALLNGFLRAPTAEL